jgi:hypothetical protein
MRDQTANIARIVAALQELTKAVNLTQQVVLTALPPAAGAPPLGQR